MNALTRTLTSHPSNQFRKNPRFSLQYDGSWFAGCAAVLLSFWATGFRPLLGGPAWWFALAAPVALFGLTWAHLLIHNATHGNLPRPINRVAGELLGLLVVVRFASWDIIHMRHHQYSDDRLKDPHPNFPSFWKTVTNTVVQVERQLFQQYFDTWGDTPSTRTHERWRARVSYGTNLVLLACWCWLLGPAFFLLVFAPANLLAGLFVIHFNWSTHNGEAATRVEDMRPVNLAGPLYRLGNALFCGIYAHQTHHDRANLFNPARQARPDKDVIFALNAEATRRAQAGESIVNATIGSLMNDDGTLSILRTVTKVLEGVPATEWAAYAPIGGTPGFLAAVVEDTFSTQPALKAAATAVATPGGTGALRHALMNYLQSGQQLLTPSFYWGPYATLCEEHERGLDTFRMFAADGTLDVAALDAKLAEHHARQGRVLLFLNDPCNNPTGYSMTRAEWRAVVEVLLKHADKPVTLLVDMAYWLYAGAGDPRAFLAELVPLLGRTGLLFAWSGSKSFTHYGLRVGALLACEPDEAARNATQAALAFACRGTWSNCVRGGLFAVQRLLSDSALRAACDTERAALQQLLQRRVLAFNAAAQPRGLRYPRYEGGFFVTVFHDEAEKQAAKMREQGVYVVPQKGALRVALCSAAEKDVPRLVDALAS